jgi:2-dehydropantoate 2-reductase
MRSDLAAVRAHGLTLREKDGVRHLPAVAAFATTEEIGPVEVVAIALKTTANGELARLLPPLLGPDTMVVTLQNGLGSDEFLASLVGAERVLGGLCFISIVRTAPGELTAFHSPGMITLGEFGRPAGDRTRALAGRFVRAGVDCRPVDNLVEARWRKLVWNIPFNGLTLAHQITVAQVMADPALTAEARALMDEVAEAARRLGCVVPEQFIQTQIDVTRPMGPYRPSSLVDFLAGREVEVEAIWGEPLRRAQAAGAAMPRLAQLYAQLKELTAR